MKKILVILPLLVLCFVYGCKKSEESSPYVSFKASTVEVPASQTKYGIFVASNLSNWTLTKDDKDTWVKILGTPSRDTSATIYIEMEKNITLEKRTATFTLSFNLDNSPTTRTLKLTQLGETKVILVDIDTLYMPANGGISTVKVNSNLAWEATSSLPFITIESGGSRTVVEKNLNLNFSENKSLGFRISKISIKEKDSNVESAFVAYQFGVGTIASDSLALVALYNSTQGANWTKKWDLNKPVKTWHGVTVGGTKGGIRVIQVNLAANNLVGTIASSISDLSYLEELALQGNQISGTIPSSIGSMHLLRYLYLHDNKLTGVIPVELANIPFLNRIHLGRNQLSGSIPKELGDLKYLNVFCVESNNLTGELPEKLGELQSLQIIYVYDNRLTDNIPETYMKNVLWKMWDAKIYICPQQNGYGFNNCPR